MSALLAYMLCNCFVDELFVVVDSFISGINAIIVPFWMPWNFIVYCCPNMFI